jgi:hypothetical protein
VLLAYARAGVLGTDPELLAAVWDLTGFANKGGEMNGRLEEAADWLDELRRLEFAVESLAHLHPAGSHQRELAENATRGIRDRLRWVRENAMAERAGKLPRKAA